MAAPKVFVAGPSVNPNLIGSPNTYLRNIADIAANRRAAQQNQARLDQDRIFKQQAADLARERLDFEIGAPAREEEQRLAQLAREAEKVQLVQNMAEGLSYSGGDRFTTLEDQLIKDPRYAALDDQGRLAARTKYIQENPSALTDPTRFTDELRRSLASTGKFTGEEIDAAVSSELSRRYPTASPDLIKSLLTKPEFKIGGRSSTGTSGSSSGSGNFSLISNPTDPAARGDVVSRIAETYDLSNQPFTLPIFGNRVDFGNLDPAKTDINQAVGMLSLGGVNSPTAQEAAFAVAFNPDNTIKPDFDWRTPEGRDRLIQAGLEAQSTEERIFNKKGGDVSRLGEAAAQALSPAEIVNAAQKYNAGLLSSLTPRALSDAEVVSTFLDSLGAAAPAPTNTTRQGDGGGGSVAPSASPEAVIAPAAAPAPAAAVEPAQEAEFQIGGPVPAEVAADRIFNLINDTIRDTANNTPGALLLRGAQEAPEAARKLFESLTPPGPGVLDPRSATVSPEEESLRTQQAVQVAQARALQRSGKIKPKGDSIKALLDAYFEYLEGQRN